MTGEDGRTAAAMGMTVQVMTMMDDDGDGPGDPQCRNRSMSEDGPGSQSTAVGVGDPTGGRGRGRRPTSALPWSPGGDARPNAQETDTVMGPTKAAMTGAQEAGHAPGPGTCPATKPGELEGSNPRRRLLILS